MKKLLVALAIAALAGAPDAQAQTYPSRPVTLIVPYPAGGPSDTLARVLAEAMRGHLGQKTIRSIYDAAAPLPDTVMPPPSKEFLTEIRRIATSAIEASGGHVRLDKL